MKFLDSVNTYLKKYWQIFLLLVGTVVGLIFFRSQNTSFENRLKKINDIHEEEIKKINDARLEEERQHDINVKTLQNALNVVQTQYDAAKKDLDDKKKKEVEDIVKQYGNDPQALAKQLSDVTGFQIVLPNS